MRPVLVNAFRFLVDIRLDDQLHEAVALGDRSQPPHRDCHRKQCVTVTTLCLAVACVLIATLGSPAIASAASYDDAVQQFRNGEYAVAAETAAFEVDRGVWSERWPRLLIQCQMTQGQHAAALQTYQEALKRYPTSIALRYMGLDVLRFNGLQDEVGQAEADLFSQMQRAFAGYITRDNLIAAGRFLTGRGEDAREVLEQFYDRVKERDPDYLDAYLATAELAIRKGDFQVAADTLQQALRLEEETPELHQLLAKALESSDGQAAAEQIAIALRINPHHLPSLQWLAERAIDRERYDEAKDIVNQMLQINLHEPSAWSLLAVIAHLDGEYEVEKLMRAAALSTWEQNPNVDHLIGKKLSEKYRFAEGAEYQNLALSADPLHIAASFQLAQDMLRLGEEEIGWEIADEVAKADPYNVVAYNLMTLRDRTSKFTVLKQDGIQVRMDAKEAKLYGDAVLELLSDAKRVLCEKYDVMPDKPILVEIFPHQNDFAIRTFGLPGGAGYLGVCFGRVITANSPASQGERPSNWKSVLWHEFCHVVTLEKTNNRMPRWLSEGISVYEERQRNPSWGEKMTPQYRSMLLSDDLTPVSDLSAAFLSPPSAIALQFAYYESSLVIEFLIEQHGHDALLAVLDDLAAGIPINDALTRHTGSLQRLDSQFDAYAKERANQFGALADWSRDTLPENGDLATWKGWTRAKPTNYWGLRELAKSAIEGGQWEQALIPLSRMQQLGVLTGERGGPLEWLARAHRELGHGRQEIRAIQDNLAQSSDALPALRRWINIGQSEEQWENVLDASQQALAIQPLLPEFHLASATAAEKLDRHDLAVEALSALLALDPVDPAALHFRLANAYDEQNESFPAKHHALMALELAPRYRDAHRLLWKLHHGVSDEDPATANQAGVEEPDAVRVPAIEEEETL
ncbi:tetratricopeptide repeat protein [Rhodopirellula bahusiensis]|uniref:tetratricopeptide repeat protein n=1 Tax=Rhodopirellula bahusiensis TaxID=2014065 RepID=UPI001E4D4765|nr:tetratricopeptide repeat protein [Rhodopirellula bahusiensis]